MSARPDLEVYEDDQGWWRWRIWANARIVAESGEGYSTRSNCRRAVKRLGAIVTAALEARES